MRFLLLFIILPFAGSSQEQNDVADIPVPYNPKPYFEQLNKTGIKSVAIISKKLRDNFRDDTLYIFQYNTAGQKEISLRLDNGVVTERTLMKYDKNNNQVEWTIFNKTGTQIKTIFYYNKFNKLDSTKQVTTGVGKTISTGRFFYIYEKGKLRSRQILLDSELARTDLYTYKDSLLMTYKSISSPKGHFVSTYTYDKKGNLLQKNTIHYFDTKSEPWNKLSFVYENGNPVAEEEIRSDNKKLLTHYTYEKSGRVKKMLSSFGENTREVEFEYNDFAMQKITVSTNSNSAYLKFYIPALLEQADFPVKYSEVFTYDNKKNLVSKKNYIDEDLVQETEYKIEYYK